MKGTKVYFVTDLHGKIPRYEKLFQYLEEKPPEVLLIGGDFLPSHISFEGGMEGFIKNYLKKKLSSLRLSLGKKFPLIGIIFGNDDPAAYLPIVLELEREGLLLYLHNRSLSFGSYSFYGYSYVPPTPFRLKDWERYDVSRFTDPGCVAPEDGFFSVQPDEDIVHFTISRGLEKLAETNDLAKSVFLFHSPPYKTLLDRAALDGQYVDHVPLDVNVGSIAIRRFIETHQPMVTLHGHIHESSRLTGEWCEKIGHTYMFSGALEGENLALVSFDISNPSMAGRVIL